MLDAQHRAAGRDQQHDVAVHKALQVAGGRADPGHIHRDGGQRPLLGRFGNGGLDLAGALCAVAPPFLAVAVDHQVGRAAIPRHQIVQRLAIPRVRQGAAWQVKAADGAAAKVGVELLQVVGELAHLRADRIGNAPQVASRGFSLA